MAKPDASPVNAAAIANALPFDRMAALGKWIAVKAEEMQQLDARIERRLEFLTKSEDSLRALCESVRQQVVAAHEATEEFNRTQQAAEEAEAARAAALAAIPPFDPEESKQLASDHADALTDIMCRKLDDRIGELQSVADLIVNSTAGRVKIAYEAAFAEQGKNVEVKFESRTAAMQKVADLIVDSTADRVRDVFEKAFAECTKTIEADFEARTGRIIESLRRAAIEQVERLSSQATIAVDPVLERIDRQRQEADARIRASVTTAEELLRQRAEKLSQIGDLAVDALEQRFARRVEQVRPRTEQALMSAERTLQNRLTQMIDDARRNLSQAQQDLVMQATQFRPQMNDLIQQSQDDLVEHLARLEEHAFSMTGWLEHRMGERVDALTERTRAAVVDIAEQADPTMDEAVLYCDEYGIPKPTLTLSIFVDRKGRAMPEPQLLKAS